MPSCGDYIMHFLTLPWKLIFALIPPTGKSYIVTKKTNFKRRHYSLFLIAQYSMITFIIIIIIIIRLNEFSIKDMRIN